MTKDFLIKVLNVPGKQVFIYSIPLGAESAVFLRLVL